MEEFFKLLSVDRDKPGSPFEVMISEYDYVSYYLKVYFKPIQIAIYILLLDLMANLQHIIL